MCSACGPGLCGVGVGDGGGWGLVGVRICVGGNSWCGRWYVAIVAPPSVVVLVGACQSGACEVDPFSA